jgi:hypothetical protein
MSQRKTLTKAYRLSFFQRRALGKLLGHQAQLGPSGSGPARGTGITAVHEPGPPGRIYTGFDGYVTSRVSDVIRKGPLLFILQIRIS